MTTNQTGKKRSMYLTPAVQAIADARTPAFGSVAASIRIATERYNAMVELALSELGLSEAEWHLILDATNGWLSWDTPRSPYYLGIEVEDHIRLNGADQTFGVDAEKFLTKLSLMSATHRYAIVDFCERWWSADDADRPVIPD